MVHMINGWGCCWLGSGWKKGRIQVVRALWALWAGFGSMAEEREDHGMMGFRRVMFVGKVDIMQYLLP